MAAGADAHGVGGACARCGRQGTMADPLEGAHIVARSQGGPDTAANMRAEHRSHNRRDGLLLGLRRRRRGR